MSNFQIRLSRRFANEQRPTRAFVGLFQIRIELFAGILWHFHRTNSATPGVPCCLTKARCGMSLIGTKRTFQIRQRSCKARVSASFCAFLIWIKLYKCSVVAEERAR